MHNVTVIVPVYRDWVTLKSCIDSLKECVGSNHKVYIVNDMSPEWESLQQKILHEIEGCTNFYYFRNEMNMGFAKTCNRAVTELDQSDNDILLLSSDTRVTAGFMEEMLHVLYAAEKHGIVCPRSNNAALATVPVKNNLGHLPRPEQSWGVYCKIRDKLPEYCLIPTGASYAMLIKRKLVREFGLFDEAYGRGSKAEEDFCMRVNQYGYNVVLANRAFVFRYKRKDFGDGKSRLDRRNSAILMERYPFYSFMVDQYLKRGIDPVDYFADLLRDGLYEKKRVLISLYEIPADYSGTSEYGLTLLEEFYKLYKDVYDIHVLIDVMADEFFHISKKYPKVWYPHTIYGQTYHIAFVPSQIFHIAHMLILNNTCLKYVFCMQDIISLRSSYILAYEKERQDAVRQSIHFCDGLTSISRFSLMDTKMYFQEEFAGRNIPDAVIYHGSHMKNVAHLNKNYTLIYDKYFFVFGNRFKHKYLAETLEILKNSPYNFIFLGASKVGYVSPNIYGYMSGMLEGDFVDYLIAESQGILFPSLYEGFGLPVLKGIEFDKKIVVNNNELNRELKAYFESYSENMLLYEDSRDIEKLLDEVAQNPNVHYKDNKKVVRTWRDAAVDSEAFIKKILGQDVNVGLLRARWNEMGCLDSALMVAAERKPFKERLKMFVRKKAPKLCWALRRVRRKQSRGK